MSRSVKIPRRNLASIASLYLEIKEVPGLSISRTLVERISSSGDSGGTPFYHFRWKMCDLADLVAYPETEEHVKQLVTLACKHKVCITPRGGGSCYLGSASPANGGLVIDMKRMVKFTINKDVMTVTTQPGIVFSDLMGKLAIEGLMLGCYPTSAYAATIGGWIGTGGITGVGTLQNWSFLDQVVSLKVITPTGVELTHTNQGDMAYLFGSDGIFGIVVEITLKVLPIPDEEVAINFGFNDLDDVLRCVERFVKTTDPFMVRFSDAGHEFRSTGNISHQYYLFIVLNGKKKPIAEEIEECIRIVTDFHGITLGQEDGKVAMDGILKHEMKIKADNPVLMLQQLYTDLDEVHTLINKFEKLTSRAILNYAYYGMIGKDLKVRIVFYTPTDNAFWTHFMASKAVLHKIVKSAYRSGGRVYTYGLQNTLYLHHFEGAKAKDFQARKSSVDPAGIMNPLKIARTKMRFVRIDVMFELAYIFRRILVAARKADIILTPPIPGKHNGGLER